jgi:CheY-like chemotaxis protein
MSTFVDSGKRMSNTAHILLVEDIRPNQMIAMSLLKRRGYTCDLAQNGQEAVQMVADNQYDLILMDLSMPVLNGFEATKQIRAMAGEKGQVPIIALSANDVPNDRDYCFEIGMQDFVGKPINVNLFYSTIEKYLAVKAP